MLSDFVTANRAEIVTRCRALVAARMAPRATELELEHGIPLFLDQLVLTLRSRADARPDVGVSATIHGSDLLRKGFTVAQVVNDYGDACQTITELAIERGATISPQDFKALNLCLDEAIGGAVTEYERQHELNVVAHGARLATENLGFFAHELRNLLGTATLACEALRNGTVGVGGSTGAVLARNLTRMRDLVDRSLSVVRLDAGISSHEPIILDDLIEELEISAMMEAKAHGHELTIAMNCPGSKVTADRQILASVLANLLQNAFKYSHPHSHVVLRVSATAEVVKFEIEDQCGGLPPGKAETLFNPFEQRSADRTGLGLGLAICMRGTLAIGGTLRVRDLPGKGCVFTVELKRG
jgi:signal transduction histidine kinase